MTNSGRRRPLAAALAALATVVAVAGDAPNPLASAASAPGGSAGLGGHQSASLSNSAAAAAAGPSGTIGAGGPTYANNATGMHKPHIVIVLIDDLGYADVGWHDNTMHTPEMDNLAKTGIVLEQFYMQSTCTPSRTMLMTGRYNIRNGMQDSVIHSTEPRGVPLDEKFISTKLQSCGYHTAAIGKWHLGMHQSAYLPLARGFDYHYGIYTGGGSHTGHFSVSQTFTVRNEMEDVIWQGYNLWENGEISDDNYGTTHSTHLYSGKSVDYIETLHDKSSADGNPFFLYLAYQAVHDPIQVGNEAYITQTNCNNMNDTNSDPSVDMANRKILCGMVAEVDDGVKSVRIKLEALKVWESTFMLVMSDNGGISIHGSINRPLRGEKADYWEGGIRVPAFASGGYLIRALANNNVAPYSSMGLMHVTDVHPTLLTLAGYESSASSDDKELDGVSQWDSWVTGAAVATTGTPREDMLININSDLFAGSGAVRVGDYKLIINPEPSESSIYAKVRKALAAQKGTLTQDALSSILMYVHQQTIKKSNTYLFNIIKNPSERTDRECEDVEQCHSLYLLDDYTEVRERLERKWLQWQLEMVPSSFKWEDDGPLADPSLFGGVWAAWRDGDNTPKAHYYGLAKLYDDGAPASADDDASTSSTSTSLAADAVVATSTLAAGLSAGDSAAPASAAASLGSSPLFSAAAALVVGLVAYKAGQRSGAHAGYSPVAELG